MNIIFDDFIYLRHDHDPDSDAKASAASRVVTFFEGTIDRPFLPFSTILVEHVRQNICPWRLFSLDTLPFFRRDSVHRCGSRRD